MIASACADDKRGWPYFESCVSAIIKPSFHCLDLGTDAAVAKLRQQKKRIISDDDDDDGDEGGLRPSRTRM